MGFSIYQELINYAHKAIKYCLMGSYPLFGQHRTTSIGWGI
jgi:hypothetical protein